MSVLAVSPDTGSLLLRFGTGVLLVLHGWPMLVSGPSRWDAAGSSFTEVMGFQLFPLAWGLFVSLSQTLGGALVVAGFFTRTAAALASFVLLVFSVAAYHQSGANFFKWAQNAEPALLFACLAIFFIGNGRYGFRN